MESPIIVNQKGHIIVNGSKVGKIPVSIDEIRNIGYTYRARIDEDVMDITQDCHPITGLMSMDVIVITNDGKIYYNGILSTSKLIYQDLSMSNDNILLMYYTDQNSPNTNVNPEWSDLTTCDISATTYVYKTGIYCDVKKYARMYYRRYNVVVIDQKITRMHKICICSDGNIKYKIINSSLRPISKFLPNYKFGAFGPKSHSSVVLLHKTEPKCVLLKNSVIGSIGVTPEIALELPLKQVEYFNENTIFGITYDGDCQTYDVLLCTSLKYAGQFDRRNEDGLRLTHLFKNDFGRLFGLTKAGQLGFFVARYEFKLFEQEPILGMYPVKT